jgi:hypothetical protein
MGPFTEGSTQIQQYSTRWVAWVATDGIRYAKTGAMPDDSYGQLTDLWDPPVPRPARFGFAFEQDALHCLAVDDGAGGIALRRKVSGTPTEYLWAGKSPVLFYNGIVEADTSRTDLVCFYLNADGDEILARLQRDNFGVEYSLNDALTIAMEALLATDGFKIQGVLYQMIWGLSTDATGGRQVFFISPGYPPLPQVAQDSLGLDAAMAAGVYFSPVVAAIAPGDQLSADQGLVGGVYFAALILVAASDALAMDHGLDGGDNFLAAVPEAAPADSLAMDGGLDGGVYFLALVITAAPADSLAIDNELSGGFYS